MQWKKWLAVVMFAGLLLIGFLPWVSIPARQLTVTGYAGESMGFGKPALLHLIFGGGVLLMLLIGRLATYRVAFFLAAFNIAWAVRNFIALSACSGGRCPEKHPALYGVVAFSLLGMILILLIDSPLKSRSDLAANR
jgi:hypothetical protein